MNNMKSYCSNPLGAITRLDFPSPKNYRHHAIIATVTLSHWHGVSQGCPIAGACHRLQQASNVSLPNDHRHYTIIATVTLSHWHGVPPSCIYSWDMSPISANSETIFLGPLATRPPQCWNRNARNTTKETLVDGRSAEHSLVPPTHSPLAFQTNPNFILPITFSERTLGSLLALVY